MFICHLFDQHQVMGLSTDGVSGVLCAKGHTKLGATAHAVHMINQFMKRENRLHPSYRTQPFDMDKIDVVGDIVTCSDSLGDQPRKWALGIVREE